MRLQGSRFAILRFSEIEEHNMSVQLRCGVSIHRARAVVLEAGCDPFTSRFREAIASHACLDEPLHLVQCDFDAVPDGPGARLRPHPREQLTTRSWEPRTSRPNAARCSIVLTVSPRALTYSRAV